ncbi:hypothetical protein [Sapientia aquatica]|uniref:Uncharacterized protein n=1 Tax=Sapientia aquatica TaxID=1549640 RepID=A0A4R5VXD7_9BURK|nr:hypothetical protein [Sapientia aquatica]TDK63580.1 hypothetical protein E2I14_15375 [Sapientia aquatica]
MATAIKKQVVEQLYFGVRVTLHYGCINEEDFGYALWPGDEAWDSMGKVGRAEYVLSEMNKWLAGNGYRFKSLVLVSEDADDIVATDLVYADAATMREHFVDTLNGLGYESYEDEAETEGEVPEQLYFAVEVEYDGEWGKAGKDVGYVKWIGSDAWCELECNQRADYIRDEIMTFFSCNNWLVKTIMLRGNSGCENYRHVVTDWLNLDDEQMFNHYVGTLENIGCIDIVADLITEADSKVDDEQYVFAPEEVLPGLELTFRIFETHTYGSNNAHDWDTYIAYIDLVSNDHWNGLTPAQRKEWMVENAKLVEPAECDFKFSHFVVDSAGDEQYLYSFSSENVPKTVFEYTAEELIASTHIAPVWEFDAFHEGYETHAEWLVVYYPELVATEDEVESEMVQHEPQ